MAATYNPDPRAPNGFRFPFHLESGESLAQRWRANGARPINLVTQHRSALKSLRGIYIDCGWCDQYHIPTVPASYPRASLLPASRIGTKEFADSHSDVDYRMNVSLPWLFRSLQ